MSKLFRTIGVGANQQTEEVTNEKIRYYKSESDLDSDLANIPDDEVIFTQEGNDDRCGIPLGMVVGILSNVVPQGFLPCNGVAFDENQFPALYILLGDNHTPDLRECNLVGAGQSTRTILDETGHAHDVYTIGQFKDDQIQNITGSVRGADGYGFFGGASGAFYVNDSAPVPTGSSTTRYANANFDASRVARTGTTTHGKNVGVNYVIKATSGLTVEQQDYVLQSLLEADSYSTDEVATGKKWIDGKDIYRKVIDLGNLPNAGRKSINHGINLGQIIELRGMCHAPNDYRTLPYSGGSTDADIYLDANDTSVVVFSNIDRSSFTGFAIIEYTKAD